MGGKPATLVEAMSSGEQGLFFYPSGNFHTARGARYRIYVWPMDGPDLVLFQTGIGPAFDQNLPVMKAIVDSIRFEGS